MFAEKKKKTRIKNKQNKTLIPCLRWILLSRNINNKVYPNFLILCWFCFTSDSQFLACAAKSHLRKINPEVHSLKFASFLSPMVSHLDSHHLSLILTDLLKEALPTLHCWLIVFSHLAQFQPAARTQLPKAGFPAPAQPRITYLSATVAKHVRQFGSQFKMGFPPKPNAENIKYYYWAIVACLGHYGPFSLRALNGTLDLRNDKW